MVGVLVRVKALGRLEVATGGVVVAGAVPGRVFPDFVVAEVGIGALGAAARVVCVWDDEVAGVDKRGEREGARSGESGCSQGEEGDGFHFVGFERCVVWMMFGGLEDGELLGFILEQRGMGWHR